MGDSWLPDAIAAHLPATPANALFRLIASSLRGCAINLSFVRVADLTGQSPPRIMMWRVCELPR